MALQKSFSLKERVKFQFRVDAFNVFNHPEFSGYNGTLNFNAYPSSGGIATGLPTIAATALGRNANGTFNATGFGTVTQVGAGALGFSRSCKRSSAYSSKHAITKPPLERGTLPR